MERDEKTVSRERFIKWLKIFAVFLAFMWICTIISKSIYVAQLPRVKVKTQDKKYIEHVVEVDGIVTAGGVQAVNVLSGLRVLGIRVQEGDFVEKGDLLFEIDLGDLSETVSDKEAELAKLRYHLSDTQFNQILESQKKEISVLWAQEDYESADKETAIAVERAQKALSDAETDLNKHLATTIPYTSDGERQEAWNQYNDWKNRLYELMDSITAKEREMARLGDELKDLGTETGGTGTQDGNTGAEGEQETDNNSEAGTDNKQETGENSEVSTENEQETDENSGENTENEQAGNEADNGNRDEINIRKDELEKGIKQADEELTALKDALTKHERYVVSQPDYSAEEIEYDSWQQTKSGLEDAVRMAGQKLEDAIFARESTLRQKNRAIASAEVLSPADSTASVYALEIDRLQSEIESLKSLKKGSGGILAESSGFVSKIQIAVGSRTADTAALLLTDADVPCQFKCSITKEQGKYLNLGDSVALKVNGTGTTGSAKLEATVDYLTESPSGGYDIICRLPENTGQPGTGGSIRRAVQGELHNTVIPIEALYREAEAYYVYTLNEKTGILGKETYVEKIKVRVADRNDTYAALEAGTVGSDAEIVIFCSEELRQGASVRLTE